MYGRNFGLATKLFKKKRFGTWISIAGGIQIRSRSGLNNSGNHGNLTDNRAVEESGKCDEFVTLKYEWQHPITETYLPIPLAHPKYEWQHPIPRDQSLSKLLVGPKNSIISFIIMT